MPKLCFNYSIKLDKMFLAAEKIAPETMVIIREI